MSMSKLFQNFKKTIFHLFAQIKLSEVKFPSSHLLASLIYGVSRNNKNGLGYSGPQKENEGNSKKLKPLYDQFVPSDIEVRTSNSDQDESSKSQKRNKSSEAKPHAQVPLKYPKTRAPQVPRTSVKANPKGPRRWVPKNQIVYLADILDSASKTPVMVPGQ